MSWLDTRRLTFSWSHSRAALFKECLRHYYWRYYAAYGRNAPDEAIDRWRIYRMARLSSVSTLVGSIVHRLAHESLRAARQGRLWGPGALEASARRHVEQAIKGSARATRRPDRRAARNARVLDVHYYGESFSSDEQAAAVDRAIGYARGLRDHPLYREALAEPERIVALESFDRFSVDGVTVYAVPDAILQLGANGLRLIDWKTGINVRQRLDRYHQQMRVYALYAHEKWPLLADPVECFIAELHTGESLLVPVVSDDIAATRDRIAASIAEMRSRLVDVEGNVARRDHFPPLAPPDTLLEALPVPCRGCFCRAACYDVYAHVGAK